MNDEMTEAPTALDWRPYFPEVSIRPLQEEVLDFVTTNFEEADYFILELPGGIGKSAIGVCLAKWFNAKMRDEGGYRDLNAPKTTITTTTVDLENQYMRSYEGLGLKQLHSAKHYTCSRLDKDKRSMSCEEGKILGTHSQVLCPGNRGCPYEVAKERFIAAPYGIMNAAYCLTESKYVGKIGKRGLLIVDEGHSISDVICAFLEIRITPSSCRNIRLEFPRVLPGGDDDVDAFALWIEEVYMPNLCMRIGEMRDVVDRFRGNDSPVAAEARRDLHALTTEKDKIDFTLAHIDPHIFVLQRLTLYREESCYALTPTSAQGFAASILSLIASKIVVMSATIIDFEYHRTELGIDPDKLAIYQAPSPFELEKRPVFYIPAAKLEYNRLEESAREAVEPIKDILEHHHTERGIIFVSSYSQARAVEYALRDQRILTHDDARGRELMLQMHSAKKNSVILSPSAHEGLDLKGDLSRFQIILKLPYPSLGSKVVKRKMELNSCWYAHQTALKILQASYRSIRGEEDYAFTYILDSTFEWFYSKNKSLFPVYWQDALVR